MEQAGAKLETFVKRKGLNIAQLAKDMKMSKQNLYQLFKSKRFTTETIQTIERVLKTAWEEIASVNIDDNMNKDKKISGPGLDITHKYINLLEKSLSEEGHEIAQVSANLKQIQINQIAVLTKVLEGQGEIIKRIDELSQRINRNSGSEAAGKLPRNGNR